jgi:hypothetical protein
MFLPDEIERKSRKVSYKEIAPTAAKPPRKPLFTGRRPEAEKADRAAA